MGLAPLSLQIFNIIFHIPQNLDGNLEKFFQIFVYFPLVLQLHKAVDNLIYDHDFILSLVTASADHTRYGGHFYQIQGQS